MKRGKTLAHCIFFLLASFTLLSLSACGGNQDITPPTITLSTKIGAAINDPHTNSPLTVKGTVDDPNATVEISANPSSILSNVVAGSNWSFDLKNLQEGSNLITITATDQKGNMNTAYISVILDTVPPPLLLGPVSTVTPNSEQKIGGISESGATVALTGTSVSAADVTPLDTGYSWEKQVTGLQDGDNTLTVQATDAAGNPSKPPVETTVTVDPAAPAVAIDSLNPAVLSDHVTLTGTADPGATLNVTVAAPATVSDIQQPTADGVWQATISGLPKGVPTAVTATAGPADAGGNLGTAVVDLVYNTAPQVLSTDPVSNDTNISVNQAITAKLDQPVLNVNNTTFFLTDVQGNSVTGTVKFDSTTDTATFTPAKPLYSGTTYTATLSSKIINNAGTPLPQHTWQFTTEIL